MLITAAQVIEMSFSNASTDPSLIKSQYIRAAQARFIRPLIGDDMYDELVAEKDANVYTGLNLTLIETYLQPALAFYVKLLCLADMRLNTTSQGLMINNSEFANSGNREDKADLAASTRDIADTLLNEAIKYIEDEDNIDSFPLYLMANTNAKNPIGGVVLERK